MEAGEKRRGGYYTPEAVVASLVKWAIRDDQDRMLDPACGDGRFVAAHDRSVGIESDPVAAQEAIARAPAALVHEGEFFTWATHTDERFECAAGNPPFIRYQTFKGKMREAAIALCNRHKARFSGLTSSWAPFIVATAALLKPGGRIAFVVPAEIGHAPYAAPVIEYVAANFRHVQVVAVREKLFQNLNEDCWLLYADGYGSSTEFVRLSLIDNFQFIPNPPVEDVLISMQEWRSSWNCRLRPFLMSATARELYRTFATAGTRRLGDAATVGIGYVSGANDFFHFRPSRARELGIPSAVLHPAVRNGRALPPERLTVDTVAEWQLADAPILLLRLPKEGPLPSAVRRYLDTETATEVRQGYKCRTRDPWYVVPDVKVPDFFLSYMSGSRPSLVSNDAGCVCTNSVHAVILKQGQSATALQREWRSPIVELSCEVEGHPLGGGMLKLEPGEASRILIGPIKFQEPEAREVLQDGLRTMREWRHCG